MVASLLSTVHLQIKENIGLINIFIPEIKSLQVNLLMYLMLLHLLIMLEQTALVVQQVGNEPIEELEPGIASAFWVAGHFTQGVLYP